MVKKSRRQFHKKGLLFLTGLIIPPKTYCFPFNRVIGKVPTSYTKEYVRRYLNWYKYQYYDFNQKISKAEKNILSQWTTLHKNFGITINGTFYESFLTRHHICKSTTSSDTFFWGLDKWPHDLFQKVLDLGGVQIHSSQNKEFNKSNFFGYSHSFINNEFKLFFKNENSRNQHDINFMKTQKGKIIDQGTVERTMSVPDNFIQGQRIDNLLEAFKVQSEANGIRYKLRMRSVFLPSLPEPSIPIIRQHKKNFHQLSDFIEINNLSNEVKIYYP